MAKLVDELCSQQ